MARYHLPGLRIALLVALTGLTWVLCPAPRASDNPAYLGPEIPVLAPADSLALLVDVPAQLDQATAEISRCFRLLKASRVMEAQWAAEQLLVSLHELRQKAPMSYSQNQRFVKLVQQAGGVRLRTVRQHLALRPAYNAQPAEPSAQPDPGEGDAGQEASAQDAPSGPAPAPRLTSLAPTLPSDSLLQAPDARRIQPQENDRVQKWIDFFTGRGRSTFQGWLTRSGTYTGMMLPVLEKNGLPPDLIHLVFIESGFRPGALSHSAASGPWQFMKSTAQVFGLSVNRQVDERRDPTRSTEAAAQYLKHLYSLFHDWPLALAAYNSGEGTVLRALSRQNTFDYWSLRLPRQTEDYVPEFMAAMTIARNPAAYGFEGRALDPPLSFDEIAVPGGVNMKVLAYLTQAPLEELRRLNPAYLRKQASPVNGGVTVRVPKGTGPAVLARLQSSDFPAALAKPEPEVVRHTVRRGETLATIARHYGISTRALARENHIHNLASRLRTGGVLRVPGTEAPAAGVPATRTGAAPVPAGPPLPALASMVPLGPPPPETRVQAETRATPSRAAAAEPGGSPRARTHSIRKGETLYAIARQHRCKVADLLRWNGLEGDAKLRPGQELRVEGE